MKRLAIETLKHIGIQPNHDFIDNCDFVELPKNTTIFKPYQSCQAYLVVVSGKVKVELTSRKGREVTLYTIDAGETCVMTTASLLNQEDYYAHGITQTEVQAISMPLATFNEAMLKHPAFMKFVISDFAKKTSQLFKLIDNISSHDVLHNLSDYLLRNHTDGHIECSASQLAKDIGTAREVVSRKLSVLEQQGLIIKQGKDITIVDISALKQTLRD